MALRLTDDNERRGDGHDDRHKKSEIKKRITTTKTIRSTIKIKI